MTTYRAKKFRITFVVAVEYDVVPENYGDAKTDEERLAIDLKNADDDPFAMLSENADWKITGEIL